MLKRHDHLSGVYFEEAFFWSWYDLTFLCDLLVWSDTSLEVDVEEEAAVELVHLEQPFFKLHFLLSCTPFLSFFLFFISNSFVSDVPGMIYRTLKMYFWKQLVHSRHLFISVFAKHLIVNQIPDDWIRTADLWCWKQPLYQLRHNPVQSWRYFKLPIKQSPNFDFIFF